MRNKRYDVTFPFFLQCTRKTNHDVNESVIRVLAVEAYIQRQIAHRVDLSKFAVGAYLERVPFGACKE